MATTPKFQIDYVGSSGGGQSLLYGEDGDYGGAASPDNAREYATKRECRLVIQDCAQRWRVPEERFFVFQRA